MSHTARHFSDTETDVLVIYSRSHLSESSGLRGHLCVCVCVGGGHPALPYPDKPGSTGRTTTTTKKQRQYCTDVRMCTLAKYYCILIYARAFRSPRFRSYYVYTTVGGGSVWGLTMPLNKIAH